MILLKPLHATNTEMSMYKKQPEQARAGQSRPEQAAVAINGATESQTNK
jgi:hypothetical protein